MTGEELGYVLELLMKKGVRDAYFTPIYMKKNRPAYILNVILLKENLNEMAKIIFKYTTTLGIRIYDIDRLTMQRNFETKSTKYGDINYKYATFEDIEKTSIEYEDLKKISDETGKSIRSLYKELI